MRDLISDLVFPEGIRWAQGHVWYSDILDYRVHAYDPATGTDRVVADLDERPSGLGFTPDGRLLIVTWEQSLLRLETNGSLSLVMRLDRFGDQCNDMVVDGHGRAYANYYVGSIEELMTASERRGGIIAVEPDGTARIVDDGLEAPNGMAISPDGRTLHVNDTHARRVYAYDVLPDGDLANRRVFSDVSGDGMCMDAEGALWLGGRNPEGDQAFVRVLEGGRITHAVPCPGRHAVAPALGGADRKTLYGCVSRWEYTDLKDLILADSKAADSDGKVRGWIVDAGAVEVPGAGWP